MLAMRGAVLLDDILGVELEARQQGLDAREAEHRAPEGLCVERGGTIPCYHRAAGGSALEDDHAG
jgi:hypothetical protein